MTDSIQAGLIFLITTVFDLYLFILTIRIILVWVGANYFNPVTRFVTRWTDFIVKPLRRFIPNYRHVELSSLVLLLVLQMVKFLFICLLSYGPPNIIGLFLLALAASIKSIIELFFYGILFQAILSWIQPGSPLNQVLYQFTSPIMRPLHRLIPPIGGLDITPIPAMILLQFLIITLVSPLMSSGLHVALG